ncbi:hypothetical protein GC175_03140 [bacterium]|nr:hypothetical protein [bacterium]
MPAIRRPLQIARPVLFAAILLTLLLSGQSASFAAGPPPVQTFYIPLPEDHVLQALRSIYPGSPTCAVNVAVPSSPINTYISISIISDGTIIYYDHWEDGFEVDPSSPLQPTTEIWGDGNAANGAPPGIPADLLNADTVIILDNEVNTTTLASVIDFDGGDRVSSSRIVAMTRAAWATGSETLLAGAVEVYDTFRWGQNFRAPVGENVDVANQLFEYTSLSIMAATDNTTVAIDADADGIAEINITLDRGESYLLDGGVQAGGAVNANAPIQVAMITGDRCDTYESRWYVLFPDEQWSDSYYSPVGTISGDGTRVFLYNPAQTALSVSWRTVGGAQTAITVPARGVNSATVPNNSGAHFFTDGSPFIAVAAVGASGSAGFNSRADWGFSLVPEEQLTAQILVGLGIGRDPTSAVNPTENGSPVWVTAVLPDGVSAPVDVCADFDGDNVGALTDAFGFKYDARYTLNPLASQKIYDSDGDQTGMVVYVCDTDANVADAKLAAAWGQAPGVASAAAPGLDLGTTAPPAATFFAGKGATLAVDPDGDAEFSPGDTVEYEVVVGNASRVPIASATISDTVPAHTVYVPDSTTFNDGVTTVAIADSPTGTPFPLDDGGVTLTDLPVRGLFTIRFRVVVDNPFPPTVPSIENTATVFVGRESARPTVETPIDRDPAIVIEKSTLGIDADVPPGPLVRPNDPITWSYRITNSGEVTLTNVVVTDSVAGVTPVYVSGDDGNNILDPNESWTYQATGSAVSGQYANVGYVQAQAADGDIGRDNDPSHYFGVLAGIDIAKTVDRPVIVSGDSVTYTVSISNTGNVALVQPNATDPLCPLIFINGDNGNGILDLGEIWRYTCTRALTADVTNTAVASGVDPLGATVTDSATIGVDVINPAIALDKSVSPVTVRAGGGVTYTLAVSNPGDVPLTNIDLIDDTCAPLVFVGGDNANSVLDPAETWTYRCTATPTADVTNTASVTGIDPLGNRLNAADSATVDVINPAVSLRKDASAPVVLSGTTVTYTLVVTNAGDVPLNSLNVTDDLCSPVVWDGGDTNGNFLLDLAESWIYRCSMPLTVDTTNNARVVAADPLNGPVSAQDSAFVDVINPALALQKVASPTTLLSGGVVTYSYTVTNPGDVAITNLALADDTCSPVTLTGGDANSNAALEPTETWAYTCVVTVTADITNTATLTGLDPLSNLLTVTDTATVDVIAPAIALGKVGSALAVQPGETVFYTYTVTNPGDSPLQNVTLSDDKCSPVTFLDGDAGGDNILAAGEVWRYTCSAAITEATTNIAVVTAQDPAGNAVRAEDSFHVVIGLVYLPIIQGPPPPPVPCPPPDGCPIPGVDQLKAIAVHEGRNRLFITSRENDRLLLIDPVNVTVLGQAETGDQPWDVVVDEGSNRVYVSNIGGGDVWVYDAGTLAVTAKIPVGGQPALMAILPELDTVFVVVREGSRIAVIQGTEKVADLESGGSGPYGITADVINQRIFVAHRDTGHVVVFGQVNGTWTRTRGPLFEDGRTMFDIAYNPANNKFYLVYANAAGEWFLDVWKPEAGPLWGQVRIAIPIGSGGDLKDPLVGGTGLAVSPFTGRAYNVNTGARSLTVLDRETNGIVDNVGLGEDPFSIAIDGTRGTVYVGLRTPGRLVKIEE